MRVAIFCRSLATHWNRGNAHFLRGISTELISRGHELAVYGTRDGWSPSSLRRTQDATPNRGLAATFPILAGRESTLGELDLERGLDGADLVLVHESTDPELVRRIGRHRERAGGYRLLFHDTHHRAVTAPAEMRSFDLSGFDGVLASGDVIRELYLDRGWAARAWTWHEAADARVFSPRPGTVRSDDLVWVGNWGTGERNQELCQMLLDPAQRLRLDGVVHGEHYPWRGRLAIRRSGLRYGGGLASHLAPAVFARHRFTVDLPSRLHVRALPGVPTIRVFEALACGIPLICSPWDDAEGLFTPGRDYLVARDPREMESAMRTVVRDRATAAALAEHGLATILARHTCAHRIDELLAIDASLRGVTRIQRQAPLPESASASRSVAAELAAAEGRDAAFVRTPLQGPTR